MKTWVIQTRNDLYIKHYYDATYTVTSGSRYQILTSSLREVKLYSTENRANSSIARRIVMLKNRIAEYSKPKKSWVSLKYSVKKMKVMLKFYEKATAVEVDVPDYIVNPKPDPLTFSEKKFGYKIKPPNKGINCKCCGVVLSTMDRIKLGTIESGVCLCPFCILKMIPDAKQIINRLDKKFVKKYYMEVER